MRTIRGDWRWPPGRMPRHLASARCPALFVSTFPGVLPDVVWHTHHRHVSRRSPGSEGLRALSANPPRAKLCEAGGPGGGSRRAHRYALFLAAAPPPRTSSRPARASGTRAPAHAPLEFQAGRPSRGGTSQGPSLACLAPRLKCSGKSVATYGSRARVCRAGLGRARRGAGAERQTHTSGVGQAGWASCVARPLLSCARGRKRALCQGGGGR